MKEKRNIKVHATSGTQETAGTPCKNIGNSKDRNRGDNKNIADGNSSRDVCNGRDVTNCMEIRGGTAIGQITATVWSDFKGTQD
jgi:hypothetical protein